jgi:predicted RNA-binding Zn ribbon-like protein
LEKIRWSLAGDRGRQQRHGNVSEPPGNLPELRNERGVTGEVDRLGARAQHEGNFVHPVPGWRRGNGHIADLGVLPRIERGDVGESVPVRQAEDGRRNDHRNALVPERSESVQVAVIVVGVADEHAVQVRQVGDADRDRFALVVGGFGAEPGVGQERTSADLDEMAAISDASVTAIRAMAAVLLVNDRKQAVRACHRAAGPLAIPLSQIARRTWSGVSCCGAWPVSASSWNFAIGMALA